MFEMIAGFVLAYLLGSLPSAIWIGKSFYGKDVRDHGSGNAGATNTFRVLGWKPGTIVFTIDTIKGFAAVYLMGLLSQHSQEHATLFTILGGFCAIFGHIYPVFAQFKGGKGVATMLGITLGIHPYAAIIALLVFIIIFMATKYVSVGSLMAGISFPITIIWVFKVEDIYLQIFSILLTVVLFYSHKTNIKRLLNGTENQFKSSKN